MISIKHMAILQKKADEFEDGDSRISCHAYICGVNDYHELLMAEPSEFDEISAHEQFNIFDSEHEFEACEFDFISGAEWQHSQSQAQISAMKARIEELEKKSIYYKMVEIPDFKIGNKEKFIEETKNLLKCYKHIIEESK